MRKITFFAAFVACSFVFYSCCKPNVKTPYTVSSAPVNNPTEVHIWGNDNGQNQSGVGSPEIGAAAWTSGDVVYMRAALKFDLSSIPADAAITSAKLTLFSNHSPLNADQVHANNGTDNTMLIQRITNSWTPSAITWLSQPAATTQNQIVIPSTTEPFLDLVDVDVSTLVKGMLGSNNNGFLLRLQTEEIYTSRIFCSSKYEDTSRYPKLVITYLH